MTNRGTGNRRAALAAGLAPLLLATACGGGDSGSAAASSGPPKVSATEAGVVAPAKIEVIAGLTGCKVKIRTEADELREGVCRTKQGDYLVTTFPEERLKRTWLDSASVYGGTYLVGTRWVVSGKPAVLERLRPRIGGTMEQLRGIGPSAGPST
ncbi:hypothetical protein ACFW20_15115 [Streptomyces nigra]|jgi:hypothetical protein|uniref:hypothetical protein n=1 Tax=Streptomyces TaxID=1883 RepID=UPI000E1D25FA|nr:hypothetical protein [Streptomyces sp. M7]RDS65826.1 hypothetical protein DWC19_08295 [Streptomyces sp. M7]